jgi:hypothetical protein
MLKATHRKEVWESEDTDPRIVKLRIEEVFAQLSTIAVVLLHVTALTDLSFYGNSVVMTSTGV